MSNQTLQETEDFGSHSVHMMIRPSYEVNNLGSQRQSMQFQKRTVSKLKASNYASYF